ncbi:polycomb protein suz12-A-like isoform X2 [Hyalella azteca]|uniref:Polycomb protein suz12-A-like isoform X2 n=1 Tax=Hyalella azteca TaxID=294128 RepID=A0A8B7NF12_HYAAZ|nr:polycomb protein suz12-A-like isoform X2 [Hyalella azteca]
MVESVRGKMAHRKKDNHSSDKSYQDMQADHELFLQAFEKPTQIYRYLRTRNIVSPIFLHRSLYYMKNRMSRNHKNRSTFKVDSLVHKLEKQQNESQSNHPGSFLNLAFIGFFDKKTEGEGDRAHLKVDVVKISHKKRKESSAPITQTCVGSHDISINPPMGSLVAWQPPASLQVNNHQHSSDGASTKEPLVSIPTNTFGTLNGHQNKSSVLQFKIELVHDQENICEPASKRRRLSRGSSATADSGSEHSSGGGSSSDTTSDNVTCYKAELVVYDRHGRCQLQAGSYELVLQPVNATAGKTISSSPRKNSTWESTEDLKVEAANISDFQNSGPTLHFRLAWSHEPGGGIGTCTAVTGHTNGHSRLQSSGTSLSAMFKTLIRPKQPLSVLLENDKATKPKPQGVSSPEAPQLVLYQFVYNNNGRQQTEARRDFHCPWCSINCLALYCLLKHLKLCHARFTFTYLPHPKGARIDVSLNDCYDGSYAGNPQDLVALSGGGGGVCFSRTGPCRRAPTTALLVCRPRRSKPSLSEFLEQDHVDYDLPRSYILGHNRLYHHTMSCRPIGPHELDEDSEGEHDSQWMRIKTVSMIDDFSDVNDGEKEIMKLWNVHVMKHNFVGDCQLPIACSMFVDAHGEEVIRRNLYRNYLLHLVSLYDFGVMGAGAVYNNIRQLQNLMQEKGLHLELSKHWTRQRRVGLKAYTSPRSAIKASVSNLSSDSSAVSSAARALLADSHFEAPTKSSGSTNGASSDGSYLPSVGKNVAATSTKAPTSASSTSTKAVLPTTATSICSISTSIDKLSYSSVVASSLKTSSSTNSSTISRNSVARNSSNASHKASCSSSNASTNSSIKPPSIVNGLPSKNTALTVLKNSVVCSLTRSFPSHAQPRSGSTTSNSSTSSKSSSPSSQSKCSVNLPIKSPSLGGQSQGLSNGPNSKVNQNDKNSPVILKAPVIPLPSFPSKISSPSLRTQTGDNLTKQILTKTK